MIERAPIKHSIYDNLQLIFPLVYGKKTKENQKAIQLYEMVRDYLDNDEANNQCIYTEEKRRKKLLSKLAFTSKSIKNKQTGVYVKFICEYGSSLIISKEKEESPVTVLVCSPEQWSSGSNSSKAKKLEICEPKNQSSLYTPQLAEYQKSLKRFLAQFEAALNQTINSKKMQEQKKKQNEAFIEQKYSAQEVQKLVKEALRNRTYFRTYYQQKQQQKNPEENQQKNKKPVETIGSQAVNYNNSQVNLSWYVTESTVRKLLIDHKDPDQSRYKYSKLMVGFKASLLEKAINEKVKGKNITRIDIINFKKCLDEIIFAYKSEVSSHTKDHKKFLQIIQRIHEAIIESNGGKVTAKIEDKYFIDEKIDMNEAGIPKINILRAPIHRLEPIQKVKIDQNSYQIDSRVPFQNLLQMHEDNLRKIQLLGQSQVKKQHLKQFFLDHWVLLTEKTLFNIAHQIQKLDEGKPNIDLLIHMRQIQCQIGASNLCKLATVYETQIKKKQSHYGMGLKGQARSHIELIKVICAVIAFESVKMNRQKRRSNLSLYRVPINIEVLYKNFLSHNREARKAMKQMYLYYKKRQKLTPLFELNGNCKSFAEFGKLVGEETRSANVWVAYMERIVQLEKQKIVENIKYVENVQRLNSLQATKNRIVAYNHIGGYNNDSWKNQTTNVNISQPLSQFSQKQKWLYAFVNNIPPDVLGLLKMVTLAQNPKGNVNPLNNNHFQILSSIPKLQQQQFPIYFHNTKTALNTKYVNSGSGNLMDHIGTTQPQNKIKILFRKYDSAADSACDYSNQIFQDYDLEEKLQLQNQNQDARSEYQINPTLKSFLKPPSDANMSRQHQVYASLSLKPKNIEVEQFLALFTTRVGEQTEIASLCNNILDRKIICNCYDIGNKLKQQVFLQTAGHLSSYKEKTQEYFGSLKRFLKQIGNVWVYSDTNFAPIIGPFINYLLMQFKDRGTFPQDEWKQLKKVCLKIAKKCMEQFERGQRQLKDNPEIEIQWDQRFIVLGAISCFRQIQITQEDIEEIIFFTKLIFQMRTCKILSDREQRPQNKRQFQKQKQFFIQKATFSHIQVISNYFSANHRTLNELLKTFDEGFPQNIVWQTKQIYEFIGKQQGSEDFYQIDLYRGCIFKNGKQLSALDPKIKASSDYKQIFGQTRQFQVFPSNQAFYMRTKNNLSHQFKVDKNLYQIFFEFSEDGKTIRYIVRKAVQMGHKMKQQIWELLPRTEIKRSFANIPKIFVQNHIAWFCRQKNCIVFRKCKYQQFYEIGLVIHLKTHSEKQLIIEKAFHIVYHGSYEDQDLDKICDKDNQIYEEIVLRSKQKDLSAFKPYQYFSKFEEPQFIFQLRNNKTNETHFVLHRYQLRFRLKDNKLVSESHYGYHIDSSYYQSTQCVFNKFACLVLKKDPKNQMILNSHKRILIVSDGKISPDGVIKKSTLANIHINSFKYDIHDFFFDIRGTTRQGQLHLVSLMLSIEDNMRMCSIQMTPLQYGMHVLKTCFTNRPLTKSQCEKLNNIIELANDQMLLLCQALWKGSKKLEQILPFKSERMFSPLYLMQRQLLQCRSLYQKKLTTKKISFRQKLMQNMHRFIGGVLSSNKEDIIQEKSDREGSSDFSSSDSQFQEESYWKNLSDYRGESLLQSVSKIEDSYKVFQERSKQLDFWNKEYPEMDENQAFPKIIEKHAVGDKESVMMKQMIKEIKKSYECFTKEEKRLTMIVNEFSLENKQKHQRTVENLTTDILRILKQIEEILDQVIRENEKHPDLICNFRPTLSKACYTRIMCYDEQLKSYFPKMDKKPSEKLKLAIKIWMDLKTRLESLERVKVLLNHEKVDIVALLRQVGSPRKQIFKCTPWICFESEMKIQIWPSQLQTYENLMSKSKEGPYCQLNMGEGKTQVIIPMIILNTVFNRKNCLPRINLLTSLYEEARGNMFRFLSVTGFQLPGFQIPFTRKVKLDQHNIYAVRDLINCFSGRAYLLVNRESRLSEVLRYNQVALNNPEDKITLEKMPLVNGQIFDIFDQIDAMMTPKKSYIFSIGQKIQLPSASIRLQIMKECLQVFVRKSLKKLLQENLATSDETQEDTMNIVMKGQYPSGLRITFDNAKKEQIVQWKKQMVTYILTDERRHEYSFVKRLKQSQINDLVDYCINPLSNVEKLSKSIASGSKNQIYILRGIFAYGILEHCLSKRCGVDYGVPGPEHSKKIAVPYEAADIPSKTSQYQHPEVSAILSYIAYDMRGLTEEQFKFCIQSLMKLTPTSRQNQYKMWIQILNQEDRSALTIDKARKINLKSKPDNLKLFNLFKKNRKAIAFWLNKCIFPRDLVQYKENISSSSFDLADVRQSVGFSGTMDNRWILPNKIKFTPCQTPSIKGTDGKMIYLVTNFTKQICVLEENDKPLWQRLIDLSLKKKTGCLIDVGAICVGKSLKDQIVPWIAEHQDFDKDKYVGISFCDENGKWQVYDIEAKYYINRGTTIPDHQTFVIFDEARTRGADLKMDGDVVAALSLGPDLTKDKLMQAAGRLRKLGRNQSIIILATHEVFSTLPTFPKQVKDIQKALNEIKRQDLIQLILAWCCHNTIHQNQNLLLQYSSLGWKYVYSKVNKLPFKQELFSDLKDKYEGSLQTKMISEISKAIVSRKNTSEASNETGRYLAGLLQKYGKNVPKQAGALDDVCEREVEAEKQKQKQQQNGFYLLTAIPETKESRNIEKISGTPYKFCQKLRMTNNFIQTTKLQEKQFQKVNQNYNELPQCYFVEVNPNYLNLISIRQASNFIKKNVLEGDMRISELKILSDLSIDHDIIKGNRLQAAFVEAKFLAGYQNYSNQQLPFLTQFFLRSLNSKRNEDDKRKEHESIVSLVLKMRRVLHKKFNGSTLEKMVTVLANEDLPDSSKQQMKIKHPSQILTRLLK